MCSHICCSHRVHAVTAAIFNMPTVSEMVQDAVGQWDYEQLVSNFQSLHESQREHKNLFIRYSQINFCLDTKIYFVSSDLAP